MIRFKGSKIQFKKDDKDLMKEYYITFRWVYYVLDYFAFLEFL